MAVVLLLGPNRWPSDARDPQAGLRIRRWLVEETADLELDWILMEDEAGDQDLTRKFLALATAPRTTHIFVLWPRDAGMAGTEDEVVMWQAVAELRGDAPECYLFHQTGVLRIETSGGEKRVIIEDPQGKSPYLCALLERGVYEQEWVDLADLARQIRQVLLWDLGVRTKGD